MEEAAAAISRGTIPTLFGHPSGRPLNGHPVLQVVQVKALQEGTRFRLVLSDTEYYVQSMLTGNLRSLVEDGTLKRGSIVELTEYNTQIVNGTKRILVITNISVLSHYGEHDKIGLPTSVEKLLADFVPAENNQPQGISGGQFYGAPQQQSVQAPQVQRNDVSDRYGAIYPIEGLSPYSHKWTIRARCTQKSQIRTWHNNNGEGRLFSITLLDESGEIRATAFHGMGDSFDQLYELFQEGQVYYISSPCSVKMAKKQFSNVRNDYELMFEKDTKVEKARDQTSVPQQKYHFTNIENLQSVEKDTTIDTIGILKEIEETQEIVSKSSGKPFQKRELTLVDDTRHQVRLTLWGDTATSFNAPLESVVAFKGVKVSDFGGKSLSLLSSGSMSVAPDIDEAHKLKGWYDAQGRNEEFSTHSALASAGMGSGRADQIKTIQQVKDEGLGQNDSEKGDFFTMKATIQFIKDSTLYYDACQAEKCNRKVIEHEPGSWHCESCDKKWPKPLHRYIMSVNVTDHTGQLWLSGFDESGRMILGKTADEIAEIKDEGGDIKPITEDATCRTYSFRCRAKMDKYQEEARVRYQIMNMYPLNYVAECARLTEKIKAYSISDNGNTDSLFV